MPRSKVRRNIPAERKALEQKLAAIEAHADSAINARGLRSRSGVMPWAMTVRGCIDAVRTMQSRGDTSGAVWHALHVGWAYARLLAALERAKGAGKATARKAASATPDVEILAEVESLIAQGKKSHRAHEEVAKKQNRTTRTIYRRCRVAALHTSWGTSRLEKNLLTSASEC